MVPVKSTVAATERFAEVYVDYELASPPPHPGSGWTRFVRISDTHSRLFPVPDGDVLLHAGDLSSWGHPSQVDLTLKWLQKLGHPAKIVIGGNHDLCLDAKLGQGNQVLSLEDSSLEAIRKKLKSKELFKANVHYLQHESVTITTSEGKTWSIFGSPSAPQYARGAFQYGSEDEARTIYQQIPLGIDILLTHTPPHFILDKTRRGKNAGCPYLAARMQDLEQCRLHVFGHIHEAWGADITDEGVRRVSVNAAVDYRGSRAIIVDLRNDTK
ncbi:Metallophosphoesterase domain-containing protein 1 [Termitomyces sp. T112]|nr:Metallophosphoesterase domain-containing protein 1 [Termitomyces sp. T112]